MSDRLALIIANSEFDDSKLSRLVAPDRDAEALAKVLRDPALGGFDDVTLLVDEKEPVVRRRIARLYHRRRRGDLLLLYYSGHGVRDERSGELYLATRDTEMDIASATALDAGFVRGQIDRSNSRRKVVVLDCCHSGAFAEAKAALGSSAGAREALVGNGYGRVILTASNALEFAWEGDKLLGEAETSVFTHFLVEGIRTGAADLNGDGQISLDELFDYVYGQVIASSKQTPQKSALKVEGQIIIAQNPYLVAKPAELQQALDSTVLWMREGAVGELERLLQGGDEGLALAARETLTRLAGDDSRRVSAAATRALGAAPAAVTVEPPLVSPPPVEARKPEPTSDVLTITAPIHLELVRVSAGEFLMGSDPAKDEQARGNEQPQHIVRVSEFYIGKYPLTNVQYAAFVRATKREAPEHWKDGRIPSGKEDHPVVHVSWRDAVAFCKWLSQETCKSFRLPTEAEWEKAARGTEGRIYPWGDELPTDKLCNFDDSVGDTTPVGQYSSRGDSPYGCADMTGNVWEWTQSLFKDYPYQAGDGREDPSGSAGRVVRGGSFVGGQDRARSAYRGYRNPNSRNDYYGFRVGVSAAPFSPASAI